MRRLLPDRTEMVSRKCSQRLSHGPLPCASRAAGSWNRPLPCKVRDFPLSGAGHIPVPLSTLPSSIQFSFKTLFIFRERGKEGERETEMWERNIDGLLLVHAPRRCKTKPVMQACALTGNRTDDLLICGMTPNQLNHTNQGYIIL